MGILRFSPQFCGFLTEGCFWYSSLIRLLDESFYLFLVNTGESFLCRFETVQCDEQCPVLVVMWWLQPESFRFY